MSRARALIPYAIALAIAAALLGVRALVATPPLAALHEVPADPRDPVGARAYAGSLLIARGGPVIVGYQAPVRRPARLVVGGREVAGRDPDRSTECGCLVVHDRIVLPAGPVAIRFAGDGARLLWHPVGRRGDASLEYVPASSLSPEPPERAEFPAWAGAQPFDGAIAAALLLLLIATIAYAARQRLRAVPREMWLAFGAVFLGACVVRWIDLSGFGQAWDEDVNWAAGRDYVTNLLSFDFRRASWFWNEEHPPIMKYLDGIGALFADGYGPARALSAIWISLGCALLVPIGARLYRLRTGVLAGVIAALLPPLVAHGQIVGHESPTVLWWSLGVLLALGMHDELPDEVHPARAVIRRRLAMLGVVVGVAFASRFINGLLGPLVVAIAVIQAKPAWWRQTLRDGLVLVPIVSIVVLYAVWPHLWGDPFGALAESFHKLDRAHDTEPFLGAFTNRPGPHYFFFALLATTPLLVLAGAIVWAVREHDRRALIVALWIVVPLAVAASPVRQGGVRYILPTLTALALASAVAWDWLATKLEKRYRRAFIAIAAALGVYLAGTLVWIHPYYLDYFAEQVGGPGTVAAHGWLPTAWWGEGADAAVAYVNTHAAPNAHVMNCTRPNHLTWFRADLWQPGAPDWIVRYAPSWTPCPIPAGARRVFEVDAGGAVLAEVWTMR